MSPPFYVLGIALIIHIIFVSITLGVGVITAIYRYFGIRESFYEDFAKRAFRIMVISELFSGVWGTIMTVILAGMFPNLLALATNVLFAPILIALISIMIRIPSIAIFWYTWGRISAKIHSAIGFVMAVSGFGIPFGFRVIFAEINYPTAIASYLSSGYADILQAFSSPVYWLLFSHSVFAGISVGGFFLASIMAYDGDNRGYKIGVKYGMAFLFLNFAAGTFYWLTLSQYSPLIYKNVTLGIYSPLFAVKILLIFALIFISSSAYSNSESAIRYGREVGILPLAILAIGEFLNGASRYPYMVVTGESGIPVSVFVNQYLEIPGYLIYSILAMLIAAVIVFLVSAFYALVKRHLEVPA